MILRLVEEEPVARVISARLHTRPRSVSHRGDDGGHETRQVAVDTSRRGGEAPGGRSGDRRYQLGLVERVVHGADGFFVERATIVGKAQCPQPFAHCPGSGVRIARDMVTSLNPARPHQPVVELLRSLERVRPCLDVIGIHEILEPMECGARGRGAPAWLQPVRCSGHRPIISPVKAP